MNTTKQTLCILTSAVAVGLFASSASATTVTGNDSASALANDLVGNNSGITVVGTPTFTGGHGTGASDPFSAGTFTGGSASGIGIDQGIVLTNGDVGLIGNTNNSDDSSAYFNGGGDPDLSNLIGGEATNDATILQFDFTTTSGDLYFQYVFASEEYNEYVNDFNDVFGFFLDGTNIAIAPGGQPVAIDNVNCGNPYVGSGPDCQYYNNNDPSDGGPFFNFSYDGFTDVFTAQALGLAPGKHTIKLAIADAIDDALDSAVFLKANSFSDKPPPTTSVPEPGSLGLFGLGLLGLLGLSAATRRRIG